MCRYKIVLFLVVNAILLLIYCFMHLQICIRQNTCTSMLSSQLWQVPPPYCQTDKNECYVECFPKTAVKTEDFEMLCVSLCLVDVEFRTIEALKNISNKLLNLNYSNLGSQK